MTHRVWATCAAAGCLAVAVLAALLAPAPPAEAATFSAGLTSITGLGDDNGNQNGMSATQVATGGTGGQLAGVSLYVAQVQAAPANHGQVAVYADSATLPGGKLVASGSQVLTANAWNSFPLTGLVVAPNTTYWLVFNVDGSGTHYRIGGGGKTAWKIPTTFGVWPATFGTPSPAADGHRYAINMTWTDSTPPPTTTPAPTTTTTTPAPPTTTTTTPPPPPAGGYPTPASTGVPDGTALTTVTGNLIAATPGQVIDAKRVTGAILIRAAGVKVTRTQIDDSVNVESGSLEITDSTIGRDGTATSCPTNSTPHGLGEQNYTALRVEIRGHEDGFRAGGSGVVVRDSYYKACAFGQAHADGIQDFPSAPGVVVDHNTFDMAHLTDGYTAPIFVHSTGTSNARITNNLAAGGVASVYLQPGNGSWTVTGNRAVDGSWDFFDYETEGICAGVTWSDNDVVTIDANYTVTGTVRDNRPCPA